MLMELKEAEDSSKHLEVCYSHFVFDQNKLHDEGTKKLNSIDYDSFKYLRIYIFCNKRKWIVDRGNNCEKHSWCINKYNIQVPCELLYITCYHQRIYCKKITCKLLSTLCLHSVFSKRRRVSI
jgi:hypothetical protein